MNGSCESVAVEPSGCSSSSRAARRPDRRLATAPSSADPVYRRPPVPSSALQRSPSRRTCPSGAAAGVTTTAAADRAAERAHSDLRGAGLVGCRREPPPTCSVPVEPSAVCEPPLGVTVTDPSGAESVEPPAPSEESTATAIWAVPVEFRAVCVPPPLHRAGRPVRCLRSTRRRVDSCRGFGFRRHGAVRHVGPERALTDLRMVPAAPPAVPSEPAAVWEPAPPICAVPVESSAVCARPSRRVLAENDAFGSTLVPSCAGDALAPPLTLEPRPARSPSTRSPSGCHLPVSWPRRLRRCLRVWGRRGCRVAARDLHGAGRPVAQLTKRCSGPRHERYARDRDRQCCEATHPTHIPSLSLCCGSTPAGALGYRREKCTRPRSLV